MSVDTRAGKGWGGGWGRDANLDDIVQLEKIIKECIYACKCVRACALITRDWCRLEQKEPVKECVVYGKESACGYQMAVWV